MQDYRAPTSWARTVISLDDEAAKTHAKQYVDGYDVELWQLDRFF